MKAEVLVIGGGSAGLAAAVAAARAGARTVLVERHGMLGGMGTASLVHTFCGLYHIDGDRAQRANDGFPAEMEERMRVATGLGPVKIGRVWVLPQHPVEFARIADELVRESGVEVLFHSELCALAPGWHAELACRGERLAIEARAVVDASGDAVAAALLSQPDERPARLQRPAFVFGIQGVAGATGGLALAGRIVEGVREAALPEAALGLHFRASGRPGEVFATLDLSGEELGAYDPTEVRCLSGLEQTGRRLAAAAVGFLREREAGWNEAYVSQWPARVGVRESRRWLGEETLTGADVMAGRRRADEVALAVWPLELRETHRGPKLRYPEAPAGIPRGALVAAGHSRLFTAGRCLSCDHEAQASIRVMGTCFATGEAAGRMAARS